MWPAEYPAAATLGAAVLVCVLALGIYSLLIKTFAGRAAANAMVTAAATIGVAIVLAAGLNRIWDGQRERDARIGSARLRHLQRLHVLLREESDALKSIAQALRDGRYFALVANDARRAVWQDQTLTADVERHFPEYYQEREHLIDAIVAHDGDLARARRVVSAGLRLTPSAEASRADLLQALVRKCGGTGVRPHGALGATDAVRAYDEYGCDLQTAYVCRMLVDRAEDLADAALLASAAARRYAEETVLHGSCTYAPGE